MHDLVFPAKELEDACTCLQLDLGIIHIIQITQYLRDWPSGPKTLNIHLAWIYSHSPDLHSCFVQMLHLLMSAFEALLSLIEDHPVFQSCAAKPKHLWSSNLLWHFTGLAGMVMVHLLMRLCEWLDVQRVQL